MSEIYSEDEEEVDDIEDEYEEEFEEMEEDIGNDEEEMASPVSITKPQPVAVAVKQAQAPIQSTSLTDEYEDEYEQDEDEYEQDKEEKEEVNDDDDDDEYEDDEYEEEGNDLREASVILDAHDENVETFVEKKQKAPQPSNNKENSKPVVTNVTKGYFKNSKSLNIAKPSSEEVEDHMTQKKAKGKPKSRSKHKNRNREPSPEWEVKSEAMPSPEKKPLKSCLKKSKEEIKEEEKKEKDEEAAHLAHTNRVGYGAPYVTRKEKILKGAVDVAMGILGGGGKQDRVRKEEHLHHVHDKEGKSSHRRRFSFKGSTPVTSKRSHKTSSDQTTLRPTPLHEDDGHPRSQYTALLSEISERSARLRSARNAHSPSGFDLGGLNEAKAEANVADAWKESAEWAYEAMKITDKAKRKKHKKRRGRKYDIRTEERQSKEAFIAQYLQQTREANSRETNNKETSNEQTQEVKSEEQDSKAPVGVPGIRELKKQTFVYDLHGRKMTQEEYEEQKKHDEKVKKESREEDEKMKAAQALLPKKTSPVSKRTGLGVLTGNIKSAYDQYVKHKQQERNNMEGLVNQLKSTRMNWLDGQAIHNMFPDGGIHLLQNEEANKPNYDIPVKWGLYEAITRSDCVIVTIEAKTSWRPGKSPYSRHNPATYKECVNALRSKIIDRLHGCVNFRFAIEVCGGWGEGHAKKVKHIEGRTEPRLGSFEIQFAFHSKSEDRLVVKSLFSKLKSHHWPNVDKVIDKLTTNLTEYGFEVLPKESYQKDEECPSSSMTVQNGYHPERVVWVLDGRPGAKPFSPTSLPQGTTNTSLFGTALNTTTMSEMTTTMNTTQAEETQVEEAEVEVEVIPEELSDWLVTLHLESYGKVLNDAGFDSLIALATITDADRDDLKGIKPGHWKVLMEGVHELNREKEELLAKEAALKREEEEKKLAEAERVKKAEEEEAARKRKIAEELEEKERRDAIALQEEEARLLQEAKLEEEKMKAAKIEREKAIALKKAEKEAELIALEKKAEEDAAAASLVRAAELASKQAEAKHAAKRAKKAAKSLKKVSIEGDHVLSEAEEAAKLKAEEATRKAEKVEEELKALALKQAEEEAIAEKAKVKAHEELMAKKRAEEEEALLLAMKMEEEEKVRKAEMEAHAAELTRKKMEAKKMKEKKAAAAAAAAAEKKKLEEEEEAINLANTISKQKSIEKKEEKENSTLTEAAIKEKARLEEEKEDSTLTEEAAIKEKARLEEEEEAARFFEEQEAQVLPRMPDTWVYVDNSGNTQGPFGSDQMVQWAPFFKPETKVAPVFDGEEIVFSELQVLYPDLSQAFLDPPAIAISSEPEPVVPEPVVPEPVEEEEDGYGDDFETEEEPAPAPTNVVLDDDYGDGDFEEEVKEPIVVAQKKPEPELKPEPEPELKVDKKKKHKKHKKVEEDILVQKAVEEYEDEVFDVEEEHTKLPFEEVPVVGQISNETSKQTSKQESKETSKETGLVMNVGARVEARFGRGADWFPGKIAKVHASSGKLDIAYDDGDFEANVKPKYVRLVSVSVEPEPMVEVEPEPVVEVEPEPVVQVVKHKSSRSNESSSHGKETSLMDMPKSFEATMEAMQSLRVKFQESGFSPQEIFEQLLSGGKKKSGEGNRTFLSLTDFRSGVKRHYRDETTEVLLGLKNAWGEGDAIDHCGNAVLAFLDLKGTGQINLNCLNMFISGKHNLASIWHRIRMGVNKSNKTSLDMLDSQLFTRYDKHKKGIVSSDELKRALKHLKHIEPSVNSSELNELVRIFSPASEKGSFVAYLDLVSWLQPVRIDKSCKRASKLMKSLLNTSKPTESDVTALLNGKETLNIGDLKLLLNSGGSGNIEDVFSHCESRAVLLHTSSSPQQLVISADGVLRIAKNIPYVTDSISSHTHHTGGNSSPTSSLSGAPSLLAGPTGRSHSPDQSLSLSGAPSLGLAATERSEETDRRSEFSGSGDGFDRRSSGRPGRPKSASTRSSKSSKKR